MQGPGGGSPQEPPEAKNFDVIFCNFVKLNNFGKLGPPEAKNFSETNHMLKILVNF